MSQASFEEIVQRRRSNRKFDANVNVPDSVIEQAIQQAILAPTSSNMQLREFYWIKSEEVKKEMAANCLGQNAAATAKHLLVVVTRLDLWKQRAKWNLNIIKESVQGEPTKMQKRGLDYYGKLMPVVYSSDWFGLFTVVRKVISFFGGLTKPFYRMGGKADQRVVAHKSAGLAAQTFMLSIAAADFDSCPMEGFDEKRVKKSLGLPCGAEINMIIGVGKGTPEGIWNPRLRLPYEEVVFTK